MRFIIFFLIFSLTINCQKNNKTRIIRLGHGLNTNHSVHKAFVFMDSILNEKSNGKMKLKIYPNEQLGTERQCLELLQIGSLDITKVSSGALENFSPITKVLGLPFLFRDSQHSYSVLDGPIGKEILSRTEKYWLKGLAFYDAGSRSFYTKDNPIHNPSDLNGLKIRVMESKIAFDMVKSLGGSPTPISFGELYTSLQQGVVDGAENNLPSFYLSRHYEVCKFYTMDEHTILPDVLLISTHSWNTYSELEKKWFNESVLLSVIEQRRLWSESEKESLKAITDFGVEIIKPSKELFQKKTNQIIEAFKGDTLVYKLIKRIRKTD